MALEAVQAQAGHLSIESTRVYLHLTNDWLAGQYRRAAELIDADAAALAEMLAVQEAAARCARSRPGIGSRRAGLPPPTGPRSRLQRPGWPGQCAATCGNWARSWHPGASMRRRTRCASCPAG